MDGQKLRDRLEIQLRKHCDSLERSALPEHHISVCIAILDAVDDFLCSWEDLDIFSELPCESVQRALSMVVSELGPGNIKLRGYLWRLLQSKIETVQCRQVILDFLPTTLPIQCDKDVKEDLFRMLRSVFEADYDALEQVLGCMSRLAQSQRISQGEAFQFVLAIIKTVPERCLHIVLMNLVEHIGNESEATIAVHSFRQEMKLLDDTHTTDVDDFVTSLSKAIVKVMNTPNGPKFFQAYLDALDVSISNSQDDESLLSLQDCIVLLLSLEREVWYSQVERIFDMILTRNGLKPQKWNRLIELCTNNNTDELSIALLVSMLSIPSLLLLAPIRNRQLIQNEPAIATSRYVTSKLIAVSNTNVQRNIISSLFCLLEELEFSCGSGEVYSRPVEEHFNACSSDHERTLLIGRQTVYRAIVETLAVIAKNDSTALKPFKHRCIDRLSPRNAAGFIESNLISTLCVAIASLDDNIDPTAGRLPDSMETLRSLLYSIPASQEQNTDNISERSIRGMILAVSIVSADRFDTSNMLALWSLVLPFLMASFFRPLSPSLKIHCITYLTAMYEWVESPSAEDAPLKTRTEIFEVITRMISASRVVKYVSSFSEWKREGATLQYTMPPVIFADHQRKHGGRKMYFSFEHCIRDRALSRPFSWNDSADWIFKLTMTYLVIGRANAPSKWLPNPWVEAAVQLPCLELSYFQSLGSRRCRALAFFNTIMRDSESSSYSQSEGSEKEFFDSLKTIKDTIVLDQILQHSVSFSLSLILGLSMSAAVLQNTYDHFKNSILSSDRSTSIPDNAVKLLQFQLFKIYDMIEGCRFGEKVFRSIGRVNQTLTSVSMKRKRNMKPYEHNKDTLGRDADEGLKQLQAFVSRLLQTTHMIQPEVLWASLVEPGHDAAIIKATQGLLNETIKSSNGKFETKLLQIIESRLNIIDHVSTTARRMTTCNNLLAVSAASRVAMNRPKFARCLRLCAHISLALSQDRNRLAISGSSKSKNLVFRKLSVLTASSFHLLQNAMMLSLEQVDPSDEGMTMDDYFTVYVSILSTDEPMNDAIQPGLTMPLSPRASFNLITSAFLKHINVCSDAAIACNLVESWSVFALHYSNKSMNSISEVTWSVVKTKYSISGAARSTHAPYILIHTLNRLLPGSLASRKRKNPLEQAVHEIVVKPVSKSSHVDKDSLWVNGILRHWAILVLSMENGDSTIYDHLAELFSNLADFLKRAHGSISSRSIRENDDDTSDGDDGEYIPPEDRRGARLPIPAFDVGVANVGTFPVIFETLLQISVATLSILSIDREALNGDPRRVVSPYRRFGSFISFFGSLVTLYKEKNSIFPAKTFKVVSRACNSMLNVSSFQLKRCIEWRNAQPIVTAQTAQGGKNDPASAEFLKGLLDVIETHVVTNLSSIFGPFDRLSGSNKDHPTKGLHLSLSPGFKTRIKSLGIKAKKLKAELVRAATVHGLAVPDPIKGTRSAEVGGDVVRNPFGGLEFLHSNETEAERLQQVIGAHLPESSSSQWDHQAEEYKSSTSDEDSISLSSSSDSFGAMGDWGGSSESEDNV